MRTVGLRFNISGNIRQWKGFGPRVIVVRYTCNSEGWPTAQMKRATPVMDMALWNLEFGICLLPRFPPES